MIRLILGENSITKSPNVSIMKDDRLIATINVTEDEISVSSNCIKSLSKDFDPLFVVRSDGTYAIEGFHFIYGERNTVQNVVGRTYFEQI